MDDDPKFWEELKIEVHPSTYHALHSVHRLSVSHLLEVPVCLHCLCKKLLTLLLSVPLVKLKGEVTNKRFSSGSHPFL